eukprot:2898797-Prymnesium_polylepis.1
MAPAGSARIVEALGINSGRAKSRRPGAPLETQPRVLEEVGQAVVEDVGARSHRRVSAALR